MLQAAYLTIGKLAPDYENVELSVGGSTVAAAVVEATGALQAWRCSIYGCCLLSNAAMHNLELIVLTTALQQYGKVAHMHYCNIGNPKVFSKLV